jgi:hypothetical protein
VNGFRYIYTAHLFPVNQTASVRIKGEGRKDLRVDEFAFALARKRPEDVGVLLEHDEEDCVGQVLSVIPAKGWWRAEFALDPAVVSAETEARIKPGMNISAGFDVIRSETHPFSGIETIREGLLRELSICREALCPGARIISRWEVPARRAAASQAVEPAGEVFYEYGGPILRRPGIGQVLAVEGRPVARNRRPMTASERFKYESALRAGVPRGRLDEVYEGLVR